VAGTVHVRGLAELNRALRRTDRDTRLGIRKELRSVAEPVRRDAETLAEATIPRIGHDWSRMRTGVTQSLVYVAPRERGTKVKSRRRKNLATLLMDRAMDPALARNEDRIEDDFEDVVDRVCRDFSK
jgi:hypothetical protein